MVKMKKKGAGMSGAVLRGKDHGQLVLFRYRTVARLLWGSKFDPKAIEGTIQ